MYLPKQSIPVQRNVISRKYHRVFGVEVSDFFVNADRIQGSRGSFYQCKCTCLTANPSVEIGGPDGVSFFTPNSPASTMGIPTIGIHRQ